MWVASYTNKAEALAWVLVFHGLCKMDYFFRRSVVHGPFLPAFFDFEEWYWYDLFWRASIETLVSNDHFQFGIISNSILGIPFVCFGDAPRIIVFEERCKYKIVCKIGIKEDDKFLALHYWNSIDIWLFRAHIVIVFLFEYLHLYFPMKMIAFKLGSIPKVVRVYVCVN